MRSRPAWLALGIIVAAGSVSYAPLTGDSIAVVALAVALAVVLAVVALVAMAGGRRGPSASLAVTSVGAAMVAARLSLGIAVGGGVGSGSGDAATPLPLGTGPWSTRVESAHIKNALQIATLSFSGSRLECSAQLPVWPRLIPGDSISWSGRVRALGDDEYDRYLAGRGIAATCEATSMTLVSHDETLRGQLEALRQATGDGLQKVLPEPEGGLAAAILVGLRDRVDRDLAAAFTIAGISHIVAISGWNIAIVAACVAALLRGFVGRRRRTIVTLTAIVAYTVFAGASPSVVRAAFMAAVAMFALESGRGSRVMVSLAWAVSIMLLADPTTAADVGFQLSAAATAGLVAWGTPLTRLIETWLPWLPGGIRETLGVSLAAQAATLPIALATFGRLSLIAPVANLVAVPLVPPAMAAGAVAFVAGWFALAGAPIWLTGLLALPAHLILAVLVGVVRIMAAVPGATATLPFPANVLGAAAAMGLAALLHRALTTERGAARGSGSAVRRPRSGPAPSRFGGRALRPALVGLALFVAAAGSVVAAAPDGAVHVIVLDVGQGDAILLKGDRGSRILIDGGPDANVLLTQLDRYVPAWDRRLDAIVLTHPHEDHVGGLVAAVQRYSIGRAFESGWPSSTPGYLAWKSALAVAGVTAERLSTGRRIGLDNASLDVLWPDDGRVRPAGLDSGATDNRMTNDSSIVLLGDYEGRRFLLTGDAEEDVDPVLLSRGLPHVDMLKVAHHGSATATSAALLDALEPSVAAISVGASNTYGHPNAGTLTRLRAHSRAVHRTDQEGTIEVTLDRSAVTVQTARSAAARVTSPVVAAPRAGSGTTKDTVGDVAWPARGQRPAPGLLYDADNVRAQPSRSRRPPALARAAGVASSPFPRRGRDGRVAGAAGGLGWASPRSPPRGRGRSSP